MLKRTAALAAALTLLAAPRAARAQTTLSAEPAPAAAAAPAVAAPVVAAPVGPRLDVSAVGVQAPERAEQATEPASVAPAVHSAGRAEALMIVGAGAFIAGALIGGNAGTVFMVGGAVVGLYGLWLYVQ